LLRDRGAAEELLLLLLLLLALALDAATVAIFELRA